MLTRREKEAKVEIDIEKGTMEVKGQTENMTVTATAVVAMTQTGAMIEIARVVTEVEIVTGVIMIMMVRGGIDIELGPGQGEGPGIVQGPVLNLGTEGANELVDLTWLRPVQLLSQELHCQVSLLEYLKPCPLLCQGHSHLLALSLELFRPCLCRL